MKKINFFLLLLSMASVSYAHDWTYKVTSTDAKDFYMWTPYVKNIRGILFSTKPGYVIGLLGDSAVRRICKEEQLAIVAYNANDLDPANVWPLLQNGLKALASQSGYPEVEFAPVCTHGHSTEGLAAIRLASYKPERCFGVIMQNAIINNDDSTTLNTHIANVPLLSIRGAEERRISQVGDFPWGATKKGILWMRRNNEKANLIIQPGAGHFGWYPFTSQYVAKWLKQASRTMIPAGVYATSAPVTINTIDQNQGWLTECPDTLTVTTLNAMTPMSYSSYVTAGKDPKRALWHFSQELAQYWIDTHKAEENKLPSKIRFNNTSYAIDNAWYNRINFSNYTQTVDLNATPTPAGLPIRYSSGWNVVEINNGVLLPNACKYAVYGNTDWGLALFDGNAQYRVTEQAQWVKVNVNKTDAAFTYTDITNKQSNVAPFAFGATYSSNPAKTFIVAGAVKVNGTNLEIEQFNKGTSTAEICYCKDQYRSNPVDVFTISYVDNTWPNPGDYVTSIDKKTVYTATLQAGCTNKSIKLGIYSNASTTAQMKLIDLTGKQTFVSNKLAIVAGENNLTVKVNQPAGIYILSFEMNGFIQNQKVVID